MLAFSLAYNFAKPNWQPFLRRLDHAGIFLMIAASYTPFTTQALTGAWSIGMTTAVWALAALGMAGKMFLQSALARTSTSKPSVWLKRHRQAGHLAFTAGAPMQ